MTEEQDRAPRTLGVRLDAQGRRLTARLAPRFPWAGPLRAVAERAADRATAFEGRYERSETAPPEEGRRPQSLPWARPSGPPRSTSPHASPPTGARAVADPSADPAAGTTPAAADPAVGRPLPADVRARLRDHVGPAADALRVHDDPAADALARAHRADAVTVGRDVHVRSGRYRPREPEGFALLVHEASHVLALLEPGAAWHRATGAAVAEEEATALSRERTAAAQHTAPDRSPSAPSAPSVPAHTPADFPDTSPPAASSPAARPATAPADRDAGAGPLSPPQPSPLDLERLKQSVLRELTDRLRTEFERGG
ncbi:DUF4157 domain-containing protein [Streptomyces sp. NBC_01275]|uniref:eCIS core domain-containing protein n=1 Tax=Streptomyces sp. NBC_01275 TaxID=2903807 RepID=UPI0022529690|nr:DUF4157 domain-containing protein [Streptomyces sp. NBC_01275]MCX4759754.1 DUF4157 domain-containing protein [Streptomyces sp. NBC_01275]